MPPIIDRFLFEDSDEPFVPSTGASPKANRQTQAPPELNKEAGAPPIALTTLPAEITPASGEEDEMT